MKVAMETDGGSVCQVGRCESQMSVHVSHRGRWRGARASHKLGTSSCGCLRSGVTENREGSGGARGRACSLEQALRDECPVSIL